MRFIFFIIVPFLHIAIPVESYKILVFSATLTKSHMISNARIADTLAKDGHDVTLLEIEYYVPPNSLNASNFAKVRKVNGPFMEDPGQMDNIVTKKAFEDLTIFKSFLMGVFLMSATNDACKNFLEREGALIEELKAEKFDLYMGEQLTLCGTGLSHLLGIPSHVLISSCPIQEHVSSFLGLQHPTNYLPSVSGIDLSDKMSIFQRFRNLLATWAGRISFNYYGVEMLTRMFRAKYGTDFPSLFDIAKNSPFVFVSVDEFVDFPRPLFSNVVYIGGLELSKPGKSSLQEPYKSEMEKGARGVVLFSLGSAVNTAFLDKRFLMNVFKAMASIPDYHFIVKINKDDDVSRNLCHNISNVFLTPWAPQTALLAHPRLKLFVSHGGYNSLLEVAQNGVPVIAMGFFADQFRNGRVPERNGWGLSFHKNLLLDGPTEFRDTVLRVLKDPVFTQNAKRTSKLLLTKPFSAEERLTKSIRFLEMNDGKLPELLSESRNLNLFASNNLDLFFVAAFSLFALFLFSLVSLKFMYSFASRRLLSYSNYFAIIKSKSD